MATKHLMLAFASVAAIATTQSALAQSAPASEEAVSDGAETVDDTDIIVTANRREQKLQDVPLSVTAISGEALRTQGIVSVSDLGTGRIPGLAVTPLFGSPTSVIINFRGLGNSDAAQATQDSPAAFYIDGIYYARSQGMGMDLVTPERIEVLRGPQGQLFGRNAEAGVVQVVSRRPSGNLDGDFTGGLGNYDAYSIKGRLDLPEISGFRIQLSGVFRRHGGYVKNIRNPNLQNFKPIQNPLSSISLPQGDYDGDFGNLKTYGGRIAIEREFGDVNVFYAYDNSYAKDSQGFTNFLNSPGGVGSLNNPNGLPVTLSANEFTFPAGPAGAPKVFSQSPINGYPKQSGYDVYNPFFVSKASGHVLAVTWSATPDLTLKSLTGIRLTNRNGGGTLTVATSPVNSVAYEYVDSESLSQELQANYSTDNFNLTMGGVYYREKIIDQRDSFVSANCLVFPGSSSPVGQLYVGPCVTNGFASQQPYRLFASQIGPFADGFRSQAGKTDSYAAYAQATYTPSILDERLELTAGLRYSNNTKSAVRTIQGGALLAVPVRNVAKTDRFDPAFTVKFDLTPDINTYARFATGFRDGGANVRSNTFNAYGLESVKTYELGFKSQFFDRHVTFNAAVFQNTVSHLQVSLQSGLPQNPSLTDTFNNPGKNKIKGFEAELSVRPLEGLSFTGSYTYLDTSPYFLGINSRTLAPFTPEVTETAAGAIIPSAATLVPRVGQPLIIAKFNMVGAPKHAGSLGMDYRTPVGSVNFLFHADWVRSGIFSSSPSVGVTLVSAAGVVTPRPTYNPGVSSNRVNAQIGITDIPLAGTSADIVFWGKNIFDHVDGGYAFGSGNGLSAAQNIAQTTVFLQPPQTYGVDFRVKF